jgi:outer membrane protein OmpA-like peptidoglycan-associated protein
MKAGNTMLLAFCISTGFTQQLKSLSGANSPNDDTNPVWIGNNTLLFTRAFHPQNLGGKSDPGDIWMTQKNQNGEWGEAMHRPDLSSTGYDVPLGLEDVLTLLVLRTENGSSSIHQYSKFGQDWNYLRKINFPGLSGFELGLTGRVVQGGKLIFLSGKKPGGVGNEDIYVSEKTGVIDWSEPLNLGKTINGASQEVGPHFDPESNTLFYSSSSHAGATGKDILVSKKLGDSWQSWSKPEKWEQISSRGSESSITFISKEEIVWTSTQNNDGFADLMTFSQPVPLEIPSDFQPSSFIAEPAPVRSVSSGRIPSPSTSSATDAAAPVKNEGGPSVPEIPISWLVMDAKLKIEIPYSITWLRGNQQVIFPNESLISALENAKVTNVKISSKNYFPAFLSVGELMKKGKTVVLMTKAESGSSVLLRDVNFKVGTAELEGEITLTTLKELSEFLIENSSIILRISGHTDNAGDPNLNKELSMERAASVRKYLVSNGVSFERLRISGWGGTKPIASNATEAGRAKNRRVELTVEN